MTNFEMTRLAAEAMEYQVTGTHHGELPLMTKEQGLYDPLHDDAQAMALMKKFELDIVVSEHEVYGEQKTLWTIYSHRTAATACHDLNRAIVECIAKMQEAK